MKRKYTVLLIACLAFLLGVTASATASSLLVEIKAILNKEVKLTLHGAPWEAKTGSTVMYPITYQGSTYLPVRALSEALGVPILWDGETKTVHIDGVSDRVPILSEEYGKFSATVTEDEQDRLVQGQDLGQVVWFEKILNSTSRFQLIPGGQYTKLVLSVGIEGDDTRIKLVNESGGSVFKNTLLTEADGIVTIEADITGMSKIMVEVMAEQPNTSSTVRIVAKDSYYEAGQGQGQGQGQN